MHNSNSDVYTASDRLPTTLLDPQKGHSYKVDETAFQDALGTTKTRWEWLEEKISPDDILNRGVGYPGVPVAGKDNANGGAEQKMVSRPELEIFGLAMLGGGRVFGAAHPYGKRFCQAEADPFSGPLRRFDVN